MWSKSTSIFVFLSLAVLWTVQVRAQGRIVGGEPVAITEVPYLMQLYYDGSFSCGGSLVKGSFVVTAAHCVKGHKANLYTVVGGAARLSDIGVKRTVKRIILPGAFSLDTYDTDVAVMQLSSPMVGENIKLIKMCSGTVPTGSTVKVSGWGLTSETGYISNEVQQVKLQTVSTTSCKGSYQGQFNLTNTMFCATNPGKDSCFGDSGGPLVFKQELCGIVSFGIGCDRPEYPGVYTNVTKISTFVNNVISQFS